MRRAIDAIYGLNETKGEKEKSDRSRVEGEVLRCSWFVSSDQESDLKDAPEGTSPTGIDNITHRLAYHDEGIMEPGRRPRSTSRPRPSSRPTTPLRSSSRTSLRDAHRYNASVGAGASRPAINSLEPQFAELADSMADLEENFVHLQLMHESLARFNESFASFLYGLNMNAFCVDFPETPIPESFTRFKEREKAREKENDLQAASEQQYQPTSHDGETTFLTTDTSFVDNPPNTSKSSLREQLGHPPD
ncbi:uncharacterized protein GIQ15_00098 [Arthroderma uncinatum]|uniref:uncharacterized protein n=1 Tax=Arthroderma uncinatum TaxID=74035 RepID=UPI00144AB98E|nr:uncharacterized protein GIQ15_00098 [Arthroderma uncinatum]KAF3490581.1 hypothetical protein GIQ15_00098 [Arthroderma uncinatum]